MIFCLFTDILQLLNYYEISVKHKISWIHVNKLILIIQDHQKCIKRV